jgi:hypothetical protein
MRWGAREVKSIREIARGSHILGFTFIAFLSGSFSKNFLGKEVAVSPLPGPLPHPPERMYANNLKQLFKYLDKRD